MDSPHPPKSMQNTMATCGNNIYFTDKRFVYGYITSLLECKGAIFV